jgi:class 3 adenylate cyclase
MSTPDQPQAIDALLDQAVEAISEGDRATANVLAERVLAIDRDNSDAEDLLAAPEDLGEIRRLTMVFIDLVDSTGLSTQLEPEIYRTVVGRYRHDVISIIERYEGHLGSTKGDGLLAFFGHPHAHEDDVKRAVQAGLDITAYVAKLGAQVRHRFGADIDVRVGVHYGLVYLDIAEDDVYGYPANLAARICSLAEPGTVVVSEVVERLIRGGFELEARLPKVVKGVEKPVRSYRVISEREMERVTVGELVGRARESSYLGQSWAQASAGTLQKPGVLLRGEAGLGKSRLAWSAVDMAERSHAVVLSLIGSPFHSDVGLRPIRRLLERRCGITRNSDPAERLRHLEREIAQRQLEPRDLIPLLAPVLSIPQGNYEPMKAEGRKLYEQIAGAVFKYLLACVRDVPALILAEDMHWFDEDTLELVGSLLEADLGGHVLIVMTSRGDVTVPKGPHTTALELEPLTTEEADRLIVSLYPGLTPDQRRLVRHRSDGIPLYIEEIVAKVKEEPSDEPSSVGVPDTLYEALFARLRSSTNALRVAETAAIVGGRFDRTLLHSVVDLGDEDIDRAIEQLVTARVLQPLDPDNWRFRHELLREVAAELSPPTVRRRLHSRIADLLVASPAQGNPDWPLIARHYQHAERFSEAASAFAQAAANAGQRGALGEARSYLSHAVAQVASSPASKNRDRLEINLRLQRAFLAQAGEGVASANAAADFERCLQLCGNDLRDDDLFATVMSLYPYYAMRADLERAERLVQSIRVSLTGTREWFLPINECGLGMLAWYRGEFGLARTKLDQAANTLSENAAQALDALLFMPNDPTAGLYTHRALARCIDGDLAAAEAELLKTHQYCERLSFPKGAFSAAYARQIEVMMRIEAGQLDRAAAVAADLASVGEQHGFDSWAVVGAAQGATVNALSEMANHADPTVLRQNIQTLTAIVHAWRESGVIALITFYDAALIRLMVAAGALEEAREHTEFALDLADRTGMHFYDAELLRLRARTTSDSLTRQADVTAALKLARSQDAPLFELRSAIDDFELRGDPARQSLVAAMKRLPDAGWPELANARSLLG